MEFLTWHYTKGLRIYLEGWKYLLGYLNHNFSLPLLLTTLFSPWKRLIDDNNTPGFDPRRIFEQITFNLISRGVGAVVRLILFLCGLVLMFIALVAGCVGFMLWLLIPPLGYLGYVKRTEALDIYIEELLVRVKKSKQPLNTIFSSTAGKFVCTKLAVDQSELVSKSVRETIDLGNVGIKSFEDITKYLVDNKYWLDKFYRDHGFTGEDLVLAARWWDYNQSKTTFKSKTYGRSGIGLELLFGYTPTLNKYSVDLSSPKSYSHHLIGREETVKRMERVLTTGSNVCLVGQPGVGKHTIVLEFAHRAVYGELGEKMSYKRILELDYNFLLSESFDLNQKKSKLSQILNEAAYAGNIILLIRDIHRLTNSAVEGIDYTDVFEKALSSDSLDVITIPTPTEYERFIAPNSRLNKYFERVDAVQPSREEALDIMLESSNNWESKTNINILVPSIRKIVDESDRFITEAPFPEKAIELLYSAIMYKTQTNDQSPLTPKDVITVLSEKTGISLAKLSKSEVEKLEKLEETIHERLVGQDAAVDMIAKSLRSRTLDVSDREKPIGSFLFLGPTGVGKTETAKVLAKVYYGSSEAIVRFDMAEYAGGEGFERLIGSVSRNDPGVLTTAIKNKPASLLLLDEIEKAPREVFNLFLTLLDEGYMVDAFGKKISARHTFVIGTSNAGANLIRQLVNSGVKGEELQKKLIDHIQSENIFSPEFLNRFDGVIVFEPLTPNELIRIAGLLFEELVKRLRAKGIKLVAGVGTLEKIAKEGYDPAFGARPMKRILDLMVGDVISKSILSGNVSDGDNIRILPGSNKDEYLLEKF